MAANICQSSERGAVVVLVAAVAVALLSAVALSVDVGLVQAERLRLQVAADAGALAGARQIFLGASVSSVITEARNVTLANLENATVSVVELGRWNGGSFTAGTVNPTAVRVVANKTVPTRFANAAFNIASLPPAAVAIAALGSPNEVNCLVPFALDQNVLRGRHYGDIIDIGRPEPGNWRKVDIDNNFSCGPCFEDAMVNGVCSRTVAVGDELSPGTGFAGVVDGLQRRMVINPIVVMPVVERFYNGNSQDVRVIGFVSARLLPQGNGNGARWTGQVQFINNLAGNSISGSTGEPYSMSRALVY